MVTIKKKIAEAKAAWNEGPENSESSKIGLKFKTESSNISNTVQLWQRTALKDQAVRRSRRLKFKNMPSKQSAVKEMLTFVVYGAYTKAPLAEDQHDPEDEEEANDYHQED
ncbi:hypothetical protein A2U01_0015525 [Trifolium medium]|uniref:Uncharacterized protein n=1 Tax=Trifolium medium TaxID=97028 RepID=A0A392N4Q9_9FABA|nr:hypothetical protein [Trifolium medium]